MNDKNTIRTLEDINELLKVEKAEQAKMEFEKLEEQSSVEYFLVKGRLHQKFQNWGESINAYNRVLEIDSQNIEANNRLHMINQILNFWNPDLLNP